MGTSGQQTLPFDVTQSRHKGNQKSVAANLRVHPHKASVRERIRIFVCGCDWRGATVKEIAKAFGYGESINRISGRITELKLTGEVFDSGREREGCAVLVGRKDQVTPNV